MQDQTTEGIIKTAANRDDTSIPKGASVVPAHSQTDLSEYDCTSALLPHELDKLEKSRRHKGMVFTLAGGALWGISGTCAQYLFDSQAVSPEWLVTLRLILAGTLMLLFLFARQGKESLGIFSSRRDLIGVILYGVVGVALCQLAYFKTISYSNAGTACILQYLSPVLIIAWMSAVHKKIPSFAELLAVVLALVGVFLVSTGGNPNTLSLEPKTLTWGFISAVAVAVYTVQPAELLRRYSATVLLAWGMVFGGIAMLPFTHFWTYETHIDAQALSLIFCVIILGTIVSFTLFMQGVKYAGPTKAGLYACIEPVVATLCAAFLLNSSFSLADIAGFTLILLVPFVLDLLPSKRSD